MGNGEWISQLPGDLQTNEAFTAHETIGDLANAHLEMAGKVNEFEGKTSEYEGTITDLNTRLENSIPKLGEDATDDDRTAFYKAFGVPEDPAEYVFPETEGVEHDEQMLTWARETFHAAKLNPDQAATISKAWDGFMVGMSEAEKQATADGIKAAEETLKGEWKADYDKNIKVTERGYQAFEKVVPGFAELLAVEISPGVKLGNDARMLKVFHDIGQRVGDDFSLPAGRPQGQAGKAGGFSSIYTKSPEPPKN